MKKHFTLVEMLIVIAIIAILVALLSPSLRKALDSSKQIACLNNLKQIGVMFHTYGSDHKSRVPVTMKFDNGNWDSYRAGFYGGEGSSLEWLMIGYGGYDDFVPGRASGSEVWLCPAGTLRLLPQHEGAGGMGAGFIYTSARGGANAIQGGLLNSYQMGLHSVYTYTDGLPPPVLDNEFRGRMRLNYFLARQPLHYCSARVEMSDYNGYHSGRSNHEHDVQGVKAPRPVLFMDGAAKNLYHLAWVDHYQGPFGDNHSTYLHHGAYNGYQLRTGDAGSPTGLLPSGYPAGPHKPFTYEVYDP